MYLARQGGMDVRLGKDAFSYEIIETWESPQTGLVFPGKVSDGHPLSAGCGSMSKRFYGQELQLHIGSMYEVPLNSAKMDLKARSLERGFGEAMSLVAFAEKLPPRGLANPA